MDITVCRLKHGISAILSREFMFKCLKRIESYQKKSKVHICNAKKSFEKKNQLKIDFQAWFKLVVEVVCFAVSSLTP